MHLTCRCGCGCDCGCGCICATEVLRYCATVAGQVNVPQMQLTRKQLRAAAVAAAAAAATAAAVAGDVSTENPIRNVVMQRRREDGKATCGTI